MVLVFDVSGSMAAKDIEPTRMEAAKAVATDFVEGQPADVRIGVVAFSDGGLNVQAPGINREGTLATTKTGAAPWHVAWQWGAGGVEHHRSGRR